jgi:hypothetical protein
MTESALFYQQAPEPLDAEGVTTSEEHGPHRFAMNFFYRGK